MGEVACMSRYKGRLDCFLKEDFELDEDEGDASESESTRYTFIRRGDGER
jgi:hypothetical protein